MKLGLDPVIHEGCTVVESHFGRYCEVGAGSRVLHSTFEDYAYCDRLSDIANTTVGKFANIAAMTRIGPTDHPWRNASLHHFLYRSSYYWEDAEDDAEFFAARKARRTVIGPDTWLGHGVIVKPDVTIGAGAIIASGAVVTKDVPPGATMVGIPARPTLVGAETYARDFVPYGTPCKDLAEPLSAKLEAMRVEIDLLKLKLDRVAKGDQSDGPQERGRA